jgi:hypothetical protein
MSRIKRNTTGGKAVGGGSLAPNSKRNNSTFQVDAYSRGGGAGPAISFAFIAGGGGGANYTGNYTIGPGGQGGGYRAGGVGAENSGGATANLGALDVTSGQQLQVTVGAGGGGNATGGTSQFASYTASGGLCCGSATANAGLNFGTNCCSAGGGSGAQNSGYTGGNGTLTTIRGSNEYFGGGGGGVSAAPGNPCAGCGGSVGGGGAGGGGSAGLYDPTYDGPPVGSGGSGNTGGGGGAGRGGSWQYGGKTGNAGGSGIVMVRYADSLTITVGAGLTHSAGTTSGGFKRHSFTSGSGVISFA